jgi:hypothetical protein
LDVPTVDNDFTVAADFPPDKVLDREHCDQTSEISSFQNHNGDLLIAFHNSRRSQSPHSYLCPNMQDEKSMNTRAIKEAFSDHSLPTGLWGNTERDGGAMLENGA